MAGSADLIPLFLAPLIGVGEGLTAPTPYQQKRSFGNLPFQMANEGDANLQAMIAALENKAGTDVTLPDAIVGDLPSFSGGGLPMTIGMPSLDASGHGALRQPYTAPGLKLTAPNYSGANPLGGSTMPTGLSGYLDSSSPVGGGANARTPGHDLSGPNGDGDMRGRHTVSLLRSNEMPDTSDMADSETSGDPTTAALSLLRHAATMSV